jgi:glycine betaine/proline transport system substrate-binding protein
MSHDSQITRRALIAGAVAACSGGAISQGLQGAQGRTLPTVTLGQVSLSFYAVTGAVVHELLERLGHPVDLKVGPHDEMFPLLGQGALDLMAAAWLPEGHAAYWARYGAAATQVARLYDGARFFWAVPDYVPQGEVATIADLARPAVAGRMTRLIQGIGTAATITTVSQTAVRAYGLDALGYSLRPGTPAEWTGAYDAAVRERRWIVFPTWAPQYLNRDGKLRPLDDPRGVLGGINHASLVAPTARFQALPAATRAALSRIDLGLDGVTQMDGMVNVDKMTPRDAARTWIRANAARFEGWLQA